MAGAGISGAGFFRLPAPGVALTATARPPASLRLAVLHIHLISLFSTLPHPCTLLRLPVFVLPTTTRPPALPHPPAFRIPLLFL